MKIWVKTEEFREGKFLVLRRDGTVPAWSYFVIGARDPAAPGALTAYAEAAEALGFDKEYVDSMHDLVIDFDEERIAKGCGDPPAPPHRVDHPEIIRMMRRAITFDQLLATAREEGRREALEAKISDAEVEAAAIAFCSVEPRLRPGSVGAPNRLRAAIAAFLKARLERAGNG